MIEKENMCAQLGLSPSEYGLVTMHRPANVDKLDVLREICQILLLVSERIKVVFPVHPRTRKNLETFGLLKGLQSHPGLVLTEPISYIPFMKLIFNCRFVLTDSGGIQEETTYLGIPCLTLRPNTERPITVTQGTNRLCKLSDIENNIENILNNAGQKVKIPDFWDGHTADRITAHIKGFVG
jgi:UDP-N-acetylglucosamine 2-epimerase (non-hydrolysing)